MTSLSTRCRAALCALVAALALTGCVQNPKLPSSVPLAPRISAPGIAQAVPGAESDPVFTFSPGDEVDLRIPDAPQFDQTARVRPDGRVTFPIVGTVRLQGRTSEDVQSELRERLDAIAGDEAAREYLLHANDEIEIKFPYQSQLNETVRLRPDGQVQLQMIGTVRAEGLSPEEFQKVLVGRYARYLRKPDLAVIVKSATSQSVRTSGGAGRAGLRGLRPILMVRSFQPLQVFVGGEVAKPGTLPYRPGLSLLQAMAEVGGQLPSGELTELVILRRAPDNSVELLQAGTNAQMVRAPMQDIPLRPFDVVILPKTDVATLADRLNQYVYNLVPFLRNSSVGAVYSIRNYTP